MKEVLLGNNNEKLLQGVNLIADAVGSTMGPGGRTVLIEKSYGPPHITKDGVSVAKEISHSDPVVNMAIEVIKEASQKTAVEAGDGTTTSCVLARDLYSKSSIAIERNNFNVHQFIKGLKASAKEVIKSLEGNKRDVKTKEDIFNVAMISTNGDYEMSEFISEAINDKGDGVIFIKEGDGVKTTMEVTAGCTFNTGYNSPYFKQEGSDEIVFNDANVIFLDGKASFDTFDKDSLSSIIQTGKPLVIIANDFEQSFTNTLIEYKLRGGINVALIEAPEYGDVRTETLIDLGCVCQTKINNNKFDNIIGNCASINIGKLETTITPHNSTSHMLTSRIDSIKNTLTSTTSEYEKGKLELRLARLNGSVVNILVGGDSRTEMVERKDRLDDALGATEAAVSEGVVIGGGMALLHIGYKFLSEESRNVQEPLSAFYAGRIYLYTSLPAPAVTILTNNGFVVDESEVEEHLISNEEEHPVDYLDYGIVGKDTLATVNMFDEGIIDPFKVTKSALLNAVSVASVLLTTNVVITGTNTSDDLANNTGMF